MADVEAWQAVLALVGTGIGSALASWFASIKTVQKRLEGSAPDLDPLTQKIAALEKADTEEARQRERLEARVSESEKRLAQCVTDDEFSAYTRHTTESVNGLTEKVGRVTGALEAWARHSPKGPG